MGINMKQKHLKLVQILLEQSDFITAKTLSLLLDVSVRSIKNYIQEINSSYPSAIHSSHEGYTINAKIAEAILNQSSNHIPQTSEERRVYILNRLIKSDKPVDTYDLCDELYISYSTVKNELQKIKRKLAVYDLQLVNNGDKLTILGLEKNKRALLCSILYEESNTNFLNIKIIQKTFLDIDIDFIKNSLLELFHDYHYFINDYSLINLVVHITIAIDRIRNHKTNMQDIRSLPPICTNDYELAKNAALKMEQYFHIKYSEAEIYELALLLISRATTINYKSINAANLEKFIGNECYSLVHELIQSVNTYYYIDLTEPEFLIRFSLHIKNLLLRSQNNKFNKNPLTEEIKTSCPLIYDVSVYLSSIIKERTGVSINDDEIAYIAFHLGSALEAQKNLNSKITAILYCPTYYDTNTKLAEQLDAHFSSNLLITNILTDESLFDTTSNADLVISTVPMNDKPNTSTMQISIFLTEKDRNRITKKIEIIKKEKKQKAFRLHLEQFILPSLFEIRNDFKTQQEVIHYMADKFNKLDYVDEQFEEELYSREKMSSTAFHDFAIPHVMKMQANKTGINVLISHNPIQWGNNQIRLVLMLCFNKNERYLFNEIFEPLTMILSEKENVEKIVQTNNYKEFINLMVEQI